MAASNAPLPNGKHPAQSNREMLVPIHGQMYRVRVVPGPLVVKGKTTASRVMHSSKVIEVDVIIPASDRWRVAALAVAYACRPKFQPVPVIGPVD
jgi:hypothetical protein